MAEPVRVLAVDDEPLALRRIELLVMRIAGVELVGKAGSAVEGFERIAELQPDVVLVDIKMGGLSGFDMVERITGPLVPLVIFVTAFDEFATKAFEVGAVDYVLKPVDLPRLTAALDRARRSLSIVDAEARLAELREVVAALRAQAHMREAKRYETEIWAERRNEFVRVEVADLDWIAAERDYVRLHARGQTYLLRETISNLETRLDPQAFMRVRRSALVRIDRVTGIRKAGYGDFRVALADGSEIRVGRTYVSRIRRLISSGRSEEAAA